MNAKLENLKKNQSLVLNNLWEKVSCTLIRNIFVYLLLWLTRWNLTYKLRRKIKKYSRQDYLNSKAKKIDLVERMVEDRLKTNEGNFNGSNVVLE